VIQDDGKGFNVEDTLGNHSRKGLGLFGMRERVLTFGGKFLLTSKQPGGTRLMVELHPPDGMP
jgi:signal transduction histidine kinase